MANTVFTPAREGHLDGSIDFDTATIKVALVRGYVVDPAHKFVSDVTTAGGVLAATSAALTGKTVTGGNADADDVTFTAPAPDANEHALLVFQASAVTGGADVPAGQQRLICWLDAGANLPIPSLNGGDVDVAWDAQGIYTI